MLAEMTRNRGKASFFSWVSLACTFTAAAVVLVLDGEYFNLPRCVGFTIDQPNRNRRSISIARVLFHSVSRTPSQYQYKSAEASSSAIYVWWYGGSEAVEPVDVGVDSCELVAVRIEKTSPNSRRIYGDISIAAPLRDVWAILTDYNRLSTHVPNLVDSRIERVTSSGEMGDGQFKCRIFQKGAQKIIGFEFGASVTMDMQEIVSISFPVLATSSLPASNGGSIQQERKITFKCADSFFFREFDGEWKVQEKVTRDGECETLLSYVVEVRPKGPVPVAALEWRIREDVPTNLRAVKKAAIVVGYDGVMSARRRRSVTSTVPPVAATLPTGEQSAESRSTGSPLANDSRGKVRWYRDETMETYLTDQ